jgi:hypothetical protein
MANLYSGIIKKEAIADGRGQSYKIRLTNQIRNLIKNADSTNVKLGLVVTGNINNTVSAKLRTAKALFSGPIGSNYYSFRNNFTWK